VGSVALILLLLWFQEWTGMLCLVDAWGADHGRELVCQSVGGCCCFGWMACMRDLWSGLFVGGMRGWAWLGAGEEEEASSLPVCLHLSSRPSYLRAGDRVIGMYASYSAIWHRLSGLIGTWAVLSSRQLFIYFLLLVFYLGE
jgi:hypothetical protein